MREVTADAGRVAYCGLYCGACGAYLKERCPGCHDNVKASWCKIRSCNIEKKIASCADCGEFSDPMQCKKFNNIMSKVFAALFRSDRAACIAQIKALGIEGYAKAMAGKRMQSIKKS
jgi:hypothetical protein